MPAIENEPLSRARTLEALTVAAYRLSAADARLRGRATRVAGALSMTHARALRILAEQGPLTISQLAHGTETSGAATTQLVHGLVAAGYVVREPSGKDRRAVSVELTAAGRERHAERNKVLQRFLDDGLASFSDAEVDAAARILAKLSELYDQL